MCPLVCVHSLFPLQTQWTCVCDGNNEVYFIWIIATRILDEPGEKQQNAVKNGVNFCKPRVIYWFLSLTSTMFLALLLIISDCFVIHFKQPGEGYGLFKIQFMIFECICSFEVILMSFFLTCVNIMECVVLRKVLPSCTRKSITLTDREHQEFFISTVIS